MAPLKQRRLALNGAELLFYPTSLLDTTVRAIRQRTMQGHANIVPVIAANRHGLVTPSEENGESLVPLYGSSFMDETGAVLKKTRRSCVLLATYDLDRSSERPQLDCFFDRRIRNTNELLTRR